MIMILETTKLLKVKFFNMPKFKLKFEFYGHHFQTVVVADSDYRADLMVRNRLRITENQIVVEEVPKIVGGNIIKDFFKGFRS